MAILGQSSLHILSNFRILLTKNQHIPNLLFFNFFIYQCAGANNGCIAGF